MLKWIMLFASVISSPAYSSDLAQSTNGFHLLDLDMFDMRAARFGCNRDPLTPDIECHKYVGRVQADFDLHMLEVFYWKNQIHTEGTVAQVETVGWHWELGLQLTPQVALFHEHHSRHRMDSAEVTDFDGNGKPDKYPVEDSYGVKLIFYISNKPHRSLFN